MPIFVKHFKTKQKGKFPCLLRQREEGITSPYRRDLLIARHLVCEDSWQYVPVFTKTSPSAVCYESGKLFSNNYRCCYAVQGCVQQMYSITRGQRVEDAVLCESSLESLLTDHSAKKPCLSSVLMLTANNWLLRHAADTGKQLEMHYLSSQHNFKHLNWETDRETVVIKSTHAKVPSAQIRQAGNPHSGLVVALAVFSIFPLEFMYMFEITKQVFGKDILDAMISHGVLLLMGSGLVKIFSMEYVLQEGKQCSCRLGQHCDLINDLVGSHPAGLPINVLIREQPPVLLQVRCADHSLVLGGIPWHYIITPWGSRGVFHVYSASDKQLAHNGVLEMGELSVEPDRCWFHPVNLTRILHVGANDVRVLQLKEVESTHDHSYHKAPLKHQVVEDYSLGPARSQVEQAAEELMTVTSSGRIVKRTVSCEEFDCPLESVQSVDYEDELDILVVTRVHREGDITVATVHLHNDDTGELVKKITLKEPWHEVYHHSIQLDKDVLVHIEKGPQHHVFYVYHLQWIDPHSDSKDKRSTSRGRRLNQHRNNEASNRNRSTSVTRQSHRTQRRRRVR